MSATTDPQRLFTKQERIGRGNFGEVFKGYVQWLVGVEWAWQNRLSLYRVENKTNRVVAIKIIDLEEVDDEIDDVQQEITVLSQCDSPYVTRYFGSYLKVRLCAKMGVCVHFTLGVTATGYKAVDCDGVPRWRINSRSGK